MLVVENYLVEFYQCGNTLSIFFVKFHVNISTTVDALLDLFLKHQISSHCWNFFKWTSLMISKF